MGEGLGFLRPFEGSPRRFLPHHAIFIGAHV